MDVTREPDLPWLAARAAGGPLDASDAFSAFLDWVRLRKIELYPAQEEAILEIMADRHVILNTPTGSGKSLVAVAMHFRALSSGRRSVYTSPIKALVSEKFFALCHDFGPRNVGMLTGDASINPRAPILCCTAEVVANIALRLGRAARLDYVIMDEFHYYSDRDRGHAWQTPLIALPETTFMLMSATLGDMTGILGHIESFTGRGVSWIRSEHRPVPLEFEYSETPLIERIAACVESGRAPIYVVSFTQRDAAELAQDLTSLNLLTRDERAALREEIGNFRFDTPYGRAIQRFIQAGVAVHHAGLLPRYRLLAERLAQAGLLKVISGTDTLGVGINVPIRTVLFTQLCKFDGENVGILSVRDFRQIAGRAGRKGFDDRGWVICQAPAHVIENRKAEAKAAASGKKKFAKAQPPKRGYVPWNEETFARLRAGEPEALQSRFRVDQATLLHLLQRGQPPSEGARRASSSSPSPGTGWRAAALADSAPPGEPSGYRALVELVARCHERPAQKRLILRHARSLFHALRRSGVIVVERNPAGPGSSVRVSPGLQDDFSLYQSLGLWVVDTLPVLEALRLPPERFAMEVITLVESIQENPTQILSAQVQVAKRDRLAELKAAGVDYEDRLAELEKITFPKPNAEFLYDSFNAWSEQHPWVAGENVRPKSIARELVERFLSFNEYVREYGIEPFEGLLLRHLTAVYKALSRTVPIAFLNDTLVDAIGYLRATIERTDSSLLREWEDLVDPAQPSDRDEGVVARARVRDISADPRAFLARVRAEMHLLLRSLSSRDWDDAAAAVRLISDSPWTAADFERALAPFFAAHASLRFDGAARLSDKTSLSRVAPHLWEIRQILCDPDDENDWFIEASIDLRENSAPEGPILAIRRIGT